MATLRQIEANRLNARRSTGPRTAEGKAIAARNATTLGLFTRELLLVDEDPAELEALRDETYQQLHPAGGIERGCVERYIAATWRLQRIMGAEAKVIARWRIAGWLDPADVLANPDALAELEKLQKHISSLERAMDRALNMLMKLQHRRRQREKVADVEIEPNSRPEPPPLSQSQSPPAPAIAPDRTADPNSGVPTAPAEAVDEARAAARIEIVKSNPIGPAGSAPTGPRPTATEGGCPTSRSGRQLEASDTSFFHAERTAAAQALRDRPHRAAVGCDGMGGCNGSVETGL